MTESADSSSAQLVYAVGRIGFDYGSEAIRDSFRAFMRNAYSAAELLNLLRDIYAPALRDLEGFLNANCEPSLFVKVDQHNEFGAVVRPRRPGDAPNSKGETEAPAPFQTAPGEIHAEWVPTQLTTDMDEKSRAIKAERERAFFHYKGRRRILANLMHNRPLASRLIWTLHQNGDPTYAIRPEGPFAAETYDALIQYLLEQQQQEDPKVPFASIPGEIVGEQKLLDGHVVPIIKPELHGMYSWNPEAFYYCSSETAERSSSETPPFARELGNPGVQSRERALNFAATLAFQLSKLMASLQGMEMDELNVEAKSGCRPRSDCWEVNLNFFDPHGADPDTRLRLVVDVSDVVPAVMGKVATWNVSRPE